MYKVALSSATKVGIGKNDLGQSQKCAGPGVGILIPKIGISGSGLKKMESGRDGMGFSIPIFFGTGRDGVFRSRFFRDGTGLKKN